MAKDNEDEKMMNCEKKKWHHGKGAMGGAYGLFFIGAAVYYIQNSTTFWMGVLGILKALVWPALLIYKVFGLLRM